MTITSETKPEIIAFLGVVNNGICEIRARWDITQCSVIDPMTQVQKNVWKYEEKKMGWQLNIEDITTTSVDDIKIYLNKKSTIAEILKWAKGAKITHHPIYKEN